MFLCGCFLPSIKIQDVYVYQYIWKTLVVLFSINMIMEPDVTSLFMSPIGTGSVQTLLWLERF